MQDLDLGSQRRNLVWVLGDGLPGLRFRKAEIPGFQVGPRQNLGPHRRRFRKGVERRPDFAASEELVALQLGQGRFRTTARQFPQDLDLCGELGWSFLAA